MQSNISFCSSGCTTRVQNTRHLRMFNNTSSHKLSHWNPDEDGKTKPHVWCMDISLDDLCVTEWMTGSLVSYCDTDADWLALGHVANYLYLSSSAALWDGSTGALWDVKKAVDHKWCYLPSYLLPFHTRVTKVLCLYQINSSLMLSHLWYCSEDTILYNMLMKNYNPLVSLLLFHTHTAKN